MKSFTLLVCVVSVVSIGRIDAGYRSSEDTGHHRGMHTACKGRSMEMSNQMRAVKCMPRKSLVKLRPEPGYAFDPSVVTVHRCDGLCTNNLSCMPVKNLTTSILVRRHNLKSSHVSCYFVDVEEHTKCKCMCNVMASDCNKHQVYIPDDCACQCINHEEQRECSMMQSMVWNPENCKCTCIKPKEECTTGWEWIPSLCRCGKVMM